MSDNERARTPLAKLEQLLAIDFSPAKFARRQQSFRRLVGIPNASARRLERFKNTALRLPRKVEARALDLPGKLERATRAEARRSVTMLDPSPLVRAFAPDLDSVASTTARDLERLAFLLGLERRPMGEPDDRRHRTSPYDDRPERSLWYRLARRLFP